MECLRRFDLQPVISYLDLLVAGMFIACCATEVMSHHSATDQFLATKDLNGMEGTCRLKTRLDMDADLL